MEEGADVQSLLEHDRVRLSVVHLEVNIAAVKRAAGTSRLDLNSVETDLESVTLHDVLEDRRSDHQDSWALEVGNVSLALNNLCADHDGCVSVDRAAQGRLELRLDRADLSTTDCRRRLDVCVVRDTLLNVECEGESALVRAVEVTEQAGRERVTFRRLTASNLVYGTSNRTYSRPTAGRDRAAENFACR